MPWNLFQCYRGMTQITTHAPTERSGKIAQRGTSEAAAKPAASGAMGIEAERLSAHKLLPVDPKNGRLQAPDSNARNRNDVLLADFYE